MFLWDDLDQDQWSVISMISDYRTSNETMNPFLGWPDLSVPLIFYDPRDLESLILICTVPMERTPPALVSFPNPVQLRH